MPPKIFNVLKTTLDKKNAGKMRSHMQKYVEYVQIICEFLDMRHNFRICNFENAVICRKIWDVQILAKYAIAYSRIASIPSFLLELPDCDSLCEWRRFRDICCFCQHFQHVFISFYQLHGLGHYRLLKALHAHLPCMTSLNSEDLCIIGKKKQKNNDVISYHDHWLTSGYD